MFLSTGISGTKLKRSKCQECRRFDAYKVLKLIRSYLDAGAVCDGLFVVTKEGTPQGGPLSPECVRESETKFLRT